MTRTSLAALLCAAAVSLTACGGDADEPTSDVTASDEPTTEEPAQSEPPEETSSPPVEEPPAASNANGQASCEDPTGDTVSGPGDLTLVSLTSDDEALSVAFTTAVPLDSAFYTLMVSSEDGNDGKQIGFRVEGGAVTEHFVFDMSDAQNLNLDAGVTVSGDTVTGVFPLDDLTDLSSPFKWHAYLSVNSQDVDECPVPGAELVPASLTFPQ